MKKNLIKMLTVLLLAAPLAGCSGSSNVKVTAAYSGSEKISTINTYIELGNDINVSGITTGVSVNDNIITIQTGGTYCISGKLDDGQIIVDAKDSNVDLVLNGVDITCSNSSPIYVKDADKTVIALADNSKNTITDGEVYQYADETNDEPDSAIYSKDDITFVGSSGSLVVNANYNDGVKGKDDLVIEGGNITVNALNDGIVGKDSLTVKEGNLTLAAGKDGLKSSNETDEGKGNITIEGGTIDIASDGDGIQGINDVVINDGTINIVTGGGSENAPAKVEEPGGGKMGMMGGMMGQPSGETQQNAGGIPVGAASAPGADAQGSMQPGAAPDMAAAQNQAPQADAGTAQNKPAETAPTAESTTETSTETSEDVSAKGIKSDVNLTINGGNITIDSYDDSIHTNGTVVINGGVMNLSSGDDGVHADSTLDINNGEINVAKSYEGIESQVININGGTIYVTSSDDGVNAGGGADGSSLEREGANSFDSSSSVQININGGYVYVNAEGDGLDANGSMYMKDGLVIVNGPTNGGNGALDYDGEFIISGGTLIAAGSNGMVQAPGESSTQNSLNIALNSLEGGNIVRIEDESGKEILTFAPAKNFGSVVVSTPDITSGTTYKVYTGGSYSTEGKDGLYEKGNYTAGTEIGSAQVSGTVTSINEEGVTSSSGMGGGRGGNGGMRGQGGRQNMNQQSQAQQ